MEGRTADLLRRVLILVFLVQPAGWVQAEKLAAGPMTTRAWALDEMKSQIGRWVADNSAHRSDGEPYDAYGMEWRWGAGEKSVIGRLFPIQGGRDLGDVWEFRMTWHPGKQALFLSQFGIDGTIGEGVISRTGEQSTEALQVFFTADGRSFQVGHRDEIKDGRKYIESFDVGDEGTWQPRRSYVWTRQPVEDSSPTLVDQRGVNAAFAPLEWLIGDWRAEFRPHGPESAQPTMSFQWGSPRRAFIRMTGTMPSGDGGLEPEYESILVWNPVEGRFVFLGVYHSGAGKVMENGHATILEDGRVRLHMRVHYPAGVGLPFSDGSKAGAEGHTYEFRRTFRRVGEDGLRGTFRLRRGESWENPHPELPEGEGYPWKRIH